MTTSNNKKPKAYTENLLLRLLNIINLTNKGKLMATLQQSDDVLVKCYIAGDELALEQLIKKHQSRIYGFIYSKILDSDLANDIFQDTFIKVIKTLKTCSYNEEGKFLPWVMRIAHNLVIDHFRKNKKMPLYRETETFSVFSIMSDDSPTIEKQIINNQVEADIKNLLDKLPDDQKEVLIMRMYQDMSFKEISEATGVSINTSLGRMRYAIINLRKMVEKHQIILTA